MIILTGQSKKNSNVLIGGGAFLAMYLGYLLGGICERGSTLSEMYQKLIYIFPRHMIGNYYNKNTLLFVTAAMIVYILIILYKLTGKRNFMVGKEFGTATYEDVRVVLQRLADKETLRNDYRGPDTTNRIISQNVRMSLDTRRTNLNNNILILGGSGAGKTYRWVKPNLYQLNGSFICTDPKGEIARSCAPTLEKNGYQIKVLNLLSAEGMMGSICYNPFVYIKTETDITKLISNLITNTTPKDAQKGDPFWENAERMLLQAIFFYIWMEEPKERQNFCTVMEFLAKAEFKEDPKTGAKLDSELDFIFAKLERREKARMERETQTKGFAEPMHIAVTTYNSVMRGAGDTVRSIIISTNARLARLRSKEIQHVLSKDEINISEIGCGIGMDGTTKTALFCVIPDNDATYNFIVGMLYTQIFQELYYQADFKYDGELPIHVTFMFDEFANVALPDDYCSLLSTMRSRNISSVIIIQNMAQIKALFKDTWETIPGNCDTLVYLGGNEQSTHKYISEMLGKATIDKKSDSVSRGKQGSMSNSYDRLGRELLLPDEVRKVDGKKCLVFIRGFNPIFDDKIDTPNHPLFKTSADVTKQYYVPKPVGDDKQAVHVQFLNEKAFSYYEKEEATIVDMTVAEFLDIDVDTTFGDNSIPMYFTPEELKRRREELNKKLEEDNSYFGVEINQENVFDYLELKAAGYPQEKLNNLMKLLTKGYSREEIVDFIELNSSDDYFDEVINLLLS